MLASPINLPRWLQENETLLQPPINNYCVYNGDFTVMIVGGPNARTDFHINPTAEYFYQHRGAMVLRTIEDTNSLTTTTPTPPTTTPTPPTTTSNATPPPTPPTNPKYKFRDIIIRQGDMFLLPANVPHSPIRFGGTVGVVIEQRRPGDALDRLRWFCGGGLPVPSQALSSAPSQDQDQDQNKELEQGGGCGAIVHDDVFFCTDLGTQVKAAVERFRADARARTCRQCGRVAEVVHRPGAVADPN